MATCLLSTMLLAGCSRGEGALAWRAAVGDGRTVNTGLLTETVAGLCLAREDALTDLRKARATYERRSRGGVDVTTEGLRASYSMLASMVAEAKADVEADLATDPPRPTLHLTLGRLIETVREGAARLDVSTDPCTKRGRR